jgi:DNA-binding YbaB/EbfC family protein
MTNPTNTPDLKELMRIAEEMQKSMKEAHDDLSKQEYVGEAGVGKKVTFIINGRHETKKVIIDPQLAPELKQESLELIAALVAAASNAANRTLEKDSEKRIMALTKKFGMPGLERKKEE